MEKKVDAAIIGSGSAGLFAAGEIKKITKNFIIINSGQYGTTCAWSDVVENQLDSFM